MAAPVSGRQHGIGLAHDLLGGGAPASSGAKRVGQLALLRHGHAAVEARVDLLPLLPVNLDEARRRHRAVEVRRALGDLERVRVRVRIIRTLNPEL